MTNFDFSKLTHQVSSIKVKNVVDMPLFYGLLILTIAFIASVFSKYEWVIIVLFCFAGLMFTIATFGYIFFTFKNPDYLRSEQYVLKKQSLEIFGTKENPISINGQNIVDITNPYQSLNEDNNNKSDE